MRRSLSCAFLALAIAASVPFVANADDLGARCAHLCGDHNGRPSDRRCCIERCYCENTSDDDVRRLSCANAKRCREQAR